jgi:hypothetical protein
LVENLPKSSEDKDQTITAAILEGASMELTHGVFFPSDRVFNENEPVNSTVI